MTVAAGEQLVTVNVDNTWPRENPIDPARHRIRQEHAKTFRRLHSILIDPVSWLPEGAWVDGQVRAFIPSRYAVCVPSQAESAIPASAREILAERGTVLDAAGPTCLAVSTDDARALVAILDVSELGKGVDDWGLAYQVPGDEGAFVVFDPVLPDGSVRARGG
jgi:hypothetical protein